MYYSSSIKEIVPKDPDTYADFGQPYENFPIVSDPVDVCLPGNYMNPEKSSDLDYNNCPIYMSQRCATNWDQKCDLYINSIDDPMLLKDFLRLSVSKKFCRLNPDSSCKVLCQPFNPIAQDSPLVCSNVGKDVLKNANDNIDIGWYLPVNMSPDYMSNSCSQTCNSQGNKISQSDIVVNACLKYGFCNDILIDMCKTPENIENTNLQRFCSNLPTLIPDDKSFSSSKTKKNPIKVSSTIKSKNNNKKIVYILILILVLVVVYMLYKKYNKK